MGSKGVRALTGPPWPPRCSANTSPILISATAFPPAVFLLRCLTQSLLKHHLTEALPDLGHLIEYPLP